MSREPLPPVIDLTVPQLLRLRAREHPVAVALSARSFAGWRDRLTYPQLVDRMEKVAAGLRALGVGADDRVGVFLGNDAGRECILTALGCLRLGAAVVPLNTRYADEELAHALDLVEPKAIVTDAASCQRLHRLCPLAMMIVIDDPAQTQLETSPWPEPLAWKGGPTPADPEDQNRLGCLLFTSGTTARSKAVMHTHRTMIGAGLCCGTALDLRPGDLYQGGWPFFTSSALNLGCMSSWVRGAGMVFEEVLDNAGRLRLVASERSTYYHGVPSVVHFMVEEFVRDDYDISSLRRVGYGGSPMPIEVVERIDQRWPGVEQVQIYGLTESGPSGSVLQPDMAFAKAGSIGVAQPYCQIEICDEAGSALAPGETGEILLRGPGVATGYYRNPKATAESFVNGGIRTGDVGHVDAEGYLFYTDRRKDVINRGGLKIASVAVEQVLYRHPSVREAAVVAIPHKDLGEDVAACVVAHPKVVIDTAALAEFCRDKLADYERPRRWLVLDELPKNPMGKVLKTVLRERLISQTMSMGS